MSPPRLALGQVFGRVARQRRTAHAVATDTHYAPGAVVHLHQHQAPFFCWVAAGGLAESARSRRG